MNPWYLLILITVFYSGYNLLVKVSSGHVSDLSSSTILATICLQLAALSTSAFFATTLLVRGGQTFALPTASFGWAILAGICIGCAEIGYFYLFASSGGRPAMPASVAIPVVVCGTVLISIAVSFFVFNEHIGLRQLIGIGLLGLGMLLLVSK